jgi:hypothetical protein
MPTPLLPRELTSARYGRALPSVVLELVPNIVLPAALRALLFLLDVKG